MDGYADPNVDVEDGNPLFISEQSAFYWELGYQYAAAMGGLDKRGDMVGWDEITVTKIYGA